MAGSAAIFDQLAVGATVALPDDCHQGVESVGRHDDGRMVGQGRLTLSSWNTCPEAGTDIKTGERQRQ